MTATSNHQSLHRSLSFFITTLLTGAWAGLGNGQETDFAAKTPIGRFVTVTSPINDTVFTQVTNAAIKLQNESLQDGRPTILVLQIESGTSQFHHVQGLAKFLTSAQISNVTTVAWIPHTVTGPNVLVALACQQIVMHPDAELGDIGRGKLPDQDEQLAVLAFAQKRHNPKLSTAILRGMMDKQVQLLRVRLRWNQDGKDQLETRVVTKDELESLQKTNVTIEDVDHTPIKESGQLGIFKGSTARALDILVVQTADSRGSVAELYGLQRESLREQSTNAESGKVRLIKIDGVIDTLQESFLVRQIERAISDGAQIIVFEIDSPGGYLGASINLAQSIARLESHKIRTIAYIPKKAISGAAIIALGCDAIFLHPDAQIGDAGPIELRPGQPFERAPEKILSPLRASLAELAERKHRPVAICEAMADRMLKVHQVTHRDNGRIWYMSEAEVHASNGEWILGPQLRETNGELLLTANGGRANELKLAEAPIDDLDDLKGRIGLPAGAVIKVIQKTWVDDLVFTLNSPGMVALMIILGIALIYLELHFTTGILAILSVLCFALFFWARFLGGTAGWLEVTLFLVGLGCFGIEMFAIPGFGVFGVSGILLIVASLVLAGHTWTVDLTTNLEELTFLTGQVMLCFGVVAIMGVAIGRALPSLPMFESMILGPTNADSDTEFQLRPESTIGILIGMPKLISIGLQGTTLTMLRPCGKARLDDRVIDVVSQGPFIAPDSPIEVVGISGSRVVVRRFES
ncbi:MAG: hypothetical protein NTW75_04300 [Planctomycetales bacterium]|jgi:membrane-bound serine protease (ClpP class)|nr:hypothetical protein [Planctomycetales bacterium]